MRHWAVACTSQLKSLTLELLCFAVEQEKVNRFYLNADILMAKILLGFTLELT